MFTQKKKKKSSTKTSRKVHTKGDQSWFKLNLMPKSFSQIGIWSEEYIPSI